MSQFEQKASCKLVCRPNRTRIRHFTERDIARISKNAVDNGVDPISVLVTIIVAFGLGALFCKIARALRFINAVREGFQAITLALTGSALVNLIIRILGGTAVKLLPIVKLITGVVALQELMFTFFGKGDDSDDLIDFLNVAAFVNDICDKVNLRD